MAATQDLLDPEVPVINTQQPLELQITGPLPAEPPPGTEPTPVALGAETVDEVDQPPDTETVDEVDHPPDAVEVDHPPDAVDEVDHPPDALGAETADEVDDPTVEEVVATADGHDDAASEEAIDLN